MPFANNFLWPCCRRHFVGQLNRPYTQFSESYGHLSLLNDLVDQRLTIRKLLSFYYDNVDLSYNMAASDRVEFSNVTVWMMMKAETRPSKSAECGVQMLSMDRARSPAISQQCITECLQDEQSASLSHRSIGHFSRRCTTSSDDTLGISKLCRVPPTSPSVRPSVHQLLPCRAISGAARDWLFARRRREISRGVGQGDNTDKRGHDLCVCGGPRATRSIKARCIVAERQDDASPSVVRLVAGRPVRIIINRPSMMSAVSATATRPLRTCGHHYQLVTYC